MIYLEFVAICLVSVIRIGIYQQFFKRFFLITKLAIFKLFITLFVFIFFTFTTSITHYAWTTI